MGAYFAKIINNIPIAAYLYGGLNTINPLEYLAYQHSIHGMGISVRKWTGAAWEAWSTWATNADTQDAPIAATYQIGARDNSNHFAANYPFTKIIAIPASVEPQAWLMAQLAQGRI